MRQFPQHIQGTARALHLAGYTSSQIERQLAQEYPDEPGPDDRTIRRWNVNSPELSSEESQAIAEANRRIALVAQRLQLERMDAAPETIPFKDLVLGAGVAQTKEHERLQRNQGPSTVIPVQIIINNAPPE